MTTTPVTLILLAAAGVGVYVLLLWFKGDRRPGLIGLHLLLGVGAAEGVVGLLHGSGLGEDDPVRATAKFALMLLVVSIFTASPGPLVFKNSRQLANALLAAHACAGLAAVFVAISFTSKL